MPQSFSRPMKMPPLALRGFTLVEVLVVVAVIAILGGLVLYGTRSMGAKARGDQTRVRMENLKSLLAEYELKTRLSSRPASWYWDKAAHTPAAGDDFWRRMNGAMPLAAPMGFLEPGANDAERLQSDAVRNTAVAMAEFQRIPANAVALGKMAAGEFLTLANGTPMTDGPMLDGWGNPILFVPGAGLWIDRDGDSNRDAGETILAPNGRPFFASAGADQVFFNPADPQSADDNIYSFEQ